MLERDKGLSIVEHTFRSCKTVEIRVRAIYHWNQNRVRAPVSRVCSPTTSNGICALGQNPLPCALG